MSLRRRFGRDVYLILIRMSALRYLQLFATAILLLLKDLFILKSLSVVKDFLVLRFVRMIRAMRMKPSMRIMRVTKI